MPDISHNALRRVLASPMLFSRIVLGRTLRPYQAEPAAAIVHSALTGQGRTFAVMMSRQAGKNETASHVEAFLLARAYRRGGTIVKAAPTFQPQAYTSLMRLESLLQGSRLPGLNPVREQGRMLRVGLARASFYSAGLQANVVGATADLLLEADEAQNIDETIWNRDFRPMAASTNATTVLWGTAWTSNTLLARTMRVLEAQELRDGQQRVFRVPWQQVAECVPAYGTFVRGEIERLGRQHPLIKTQYCLEEIDEAAGMFSVDVRALMQGSHLRQRGPTEGRCYALLIDVAGGAEESLRDAALREAQPRKDSTAVTVIELDQTEQGMNRYLVMDRHLWTGHYQDELLGVLLALADRWQAQTLVVDATGLGAGLASSLQRHLGQRINPVTFNAGVKSDLGWGFLGICSSGRFLDHADDGSEQYAAFWQQVRAATYEVYDGALKRMRWGVVDPTIHDDLLISAALCAVLEARAVSLPTESAVIEVSDPLSAQY